MSNLKNFAVYSVELHRENSGEKLAKIDLAKFSRIPVIVNKIS